MKKLFIKPFIILVTIVGISSFAFAQKTIPKHGNKSKMLEKVIPVTGVVNEWVYNDDFVYDGFYIQTDTEKLFVKFPKHLGQELRNSIAKNNITINGVINYSPLGEKEVKFISINSNGKIIYDIPQDKPVTPPTEKFISNKGKIVQFQQNDKGDTVGLILDNKAILRMPPHKINQLLPLLTIGDSITFTGMEKPKNNNEAYADDYSIIKCTTITINGEQYLVK